MLPKRLLDGMQRSWDLDHLYQRFQDQKAGKRREMVYPGQEWLLGYAIPPFQRPLVWDEERKIRFVESAQLGIHLGIFVYNSTDAYPDEVIDGKHYFQRTHFWLIDGQQRLSALESYFNNDFPMFGHYFDDLDVVSKRRFLRTPFHATEISTDNEAKLRELYDRMNFGGVAHTADQTASSEDEPVFPSGMGR